MGAWRFLKFAGFVWADFFRWYVKAKAAGHSEEFYRRSLPLWAKGVSDAAGIDLQPEGLDRIDTGPYLVAPNHQGYLDVPALIAVMPGRPRFVGKRELWKWPFFGKLLAGSGMIPINRGDRRQAIAAIEAALRDLAPGDMVYMFPEGTRSRDGTLGRTKRGVFYFAIHTGLPILPVAITGSFDRLPRSQYAEMNPGPIRIRVLDPLLPAPAAGDAQVDELQARWEEIIREALGEAGATPMSPQAN